MDKKKRAIALGLASTMLASMTSVVSFADGEDDPVAEAITITCAKAATLNSNDEAVYGSEDKTYTNWSTNMSSVKSVRMSGNTITVEAELGKMKNAFAGTGQTDSDGRGKAFPIIVNLSAAATANYYIDYNDESENRPSGTDGDRVKDAWKLDGTTGTDKGEYSDNECIVWLSEGWTGDGHKIRFGENGDDYTVKVVDVTEYNVSATATNGDSDNYTASVTASSKVKVGDTVTITVEPKNNYSFKDTDLTITAPKVDSVVFANSDEDGTYTAVVTITDAMVKNISDGTLAFTVNGTVKKYVTLAFDKSGLTPATGSDLENEVEVTLKDSEGNAVTDETKLFAGDKLTLTVKPKAGFKFSAEEGKALTVKLGETLVAGEGGVYTVDISDVSSALTLTVAGELAKDEANYNVTLPTSDKYTVTGKYTVEEEKVTNLSAVPAGTEVTLAVTAKEGYKLVSAKLGEGEPVNAGDNGTVTLKYVVNGADATDGTITLPALTVATKKIITPAFGSEATEVKLEKIASEYNVETDGSAITESAKNALGDSVKDLTEGDYTLTAADSVTDGKVKVTFALTDEGKTKYELSGEAPTVNVPVKFWNEYTVSTGTAPENTTVTAKVGENAIGSGKVHQTQTITIEVAPESGYAINEKPNITSLEGVEFGESANEGVWSATYDVTGSEVGDAITFAISAKALKINATPTADSYTINYSAETIANNGSDTTTFYADEAGKTEIKGSITSYIGKTIYAINKGDGKATADSAALEIKVPARPAATFGSTQATGQDDEKKGKILVNGSAATANQIEIKDGTSTKAYEVDGIATGTYQVRLKATESAFASEWAEVVISDTEVVSGTVTGTDAPAVTFTDAEKTGSATVTVKNTGNTTAKFTLTATNEATVSDSGTCSLDAGKSKTFTISIKGTNAGTYSSTVTVKTSETNTIGTAPVKFVINKAETSIIGLVDKTVDFNTADEKGVIDLSNLTVTGTGLSDVKPTITVNSTTGISVDDNNKITVTKGKAINGTYTITANYKGGENHEAVTVTAKLVVANSKSSSSGTGTGSGGGSGSHGGSGSSSGGSSSSSSSSTATTPAGVASDVSSAKKGDTVSSNGVTELPASTVKAAADKGVVLEAKVDSTFTWNVDTANLTDKNAKLNLKVTSETVATTTINKNVVGLDTKPVTKTIGFATQTGDKSKSEKLVIATGDKSTTTETKYATLFKKNADGTLTAVAAVVIDKNGKAAMPIKEAGSYVLVTSTETKLMGDLDNDCTINAKDAANELSGLVAGTINSKKTPKGDFNGDGYVNALDAVTILKSIVAGK